MSKIQVYDDDNNATVYEFIAYDPGLTIEEIDKLNDVFCRVYDDDDVFIGWV